MKPAVPPPRAVGYETPEYLLMRDMQPHWHLHDGNMRLFIVGAHNQLDGWFPVTTPDSSATVHGTPDERHIAGEAVAWLRLHQSENQAAGPADIRAALVRFGWTPDELTHYPDENTPC